MPYAKDENETRFIPIKDHRFPEEGDLIYARERNAINIVLSVSDVREMEPVYPVDKKKLRYVYVRSVRYGLIHRGIFTHVNGNRSRSIQWFFNNHNSWEIVEEYQLFLVNNAKRRRDIVESLKDTVTCWIPKE
jgi:hypothetical protein